MLDELVLAIFSAIKVLLYRVENMEHNTWHRYACSSDNIKHQAVLDTERSLMETVRMFCLSTTDRTV